MNSKFYQRLAVAVVVAGLFGCASSIEQVNLKEPRAEKKTYEQGVQAYNERHFSRALDIWVDVAEQGDPAALNALGMMYQSGKGVSRDVGTAARLYKKAAVAGLPAAQNNLAVLYEGGEGVPQDLVKAVDLYRRAASQGHVWAQYNLGRLHTSGIGVKKDESVAHDWFNEAESTKTMLEEADQVEPNR